MKKIGLVVLVVGLLGNNIVVAQPPKFEDGYKGIKWNWKENQIVGFLSSNGYKLSDKSEYKIPDGRTAKWLYFKNGDYDHFHSSKSFYEQSIKFLNDSIYSIEYTDHFNWNHNFQMAYNVAEEIATKYNLPRTSSQTLVFGIERIVWLRDYPPWRVLLSFHWDPNIIHDRYIGGEATRYVSIWIFNIENEKKFREIVSISRIERRKKERSK